MERECIESVGTVFAFHIAVVITATAVTSIQYPASLRAEYWKFTNLLDWIDVCCGWPKQFVFAPKSSQIDE